MATLRNKRKLADVSRETQENTRNGQSQNTIFPGMTEEYITQVSEEIAGRVTKKLSLWFSWTYSRILSALSKLDERLLSPQVRTCSVALPGTSGNNDSENREPAGDRSLNDHHPEVEFSACRISNLTDSDPEETSHRNLFSNVDGSQRQLCFLKERMNYQNHWLDLQRLFIRFG